MGVEILWLMPVHPIGFPNRKGSMGSYYSISDHKGINPEFGNFDDFRALVNTAHEMGMKVILDWVANHAAWDHVWTKTNPEFFVRNENGFVSPYDWTDVIQIDHNNHDQQNAMIDAMNFWVKEFKIDGFRADLAHLTPLAFWIKARHEVDSENKLVWLAESEEPSYAEAFDILFTWKWMHFAQEHVGKRNGETFRDFLLSDTIPGLRLFFISNHDENSWNGTEYEKYGIYAQALAVLSCTWKHSIPLIYSGQEIPNQKRLQFFEKDHLEWKEPKLHEFYKTLLQLRRSELFSTEAAFSVLDAAPGLFVYKREMNDGSLIVILNFSGSTSAYPVPGNYIDVFTGTAVSDGELMIEPAGYQVLLR